MSMFTPEEIERAYRETGTVPLYGDYYQVRPDNEIHACPIIAVGIHRKVIADSDLHKMSKDGQDEWIAARLGITIDQFRGFTFGFDNTDLAYCADHINKVSYVPPDSEAERHRQFFDAYHLGQDVRKSLFVCVDEDNRDWYA